MRLCLPLYFNDYNQWFVKPYEAFINALLICSGSAGPLEQGLVSGGSDGYLIVWRIKLNNSDRPWEIAARLQASLTRQSSCQHLSSLDLDDMHISN